MPLGLTRAGRLVPVVDDLGFLGDENAGVVRPFVDRVVHPVEVAPPEGLVLALVKAACRGHHRDGGLLDGAFLDTIAGELHQGAVHRVGYLCGAAGFGKAHRLWAARRHLRFDGAGHQPVP